MTIIKKLVAKNYDPRFPYIKGPKNGVCEHSPSAGLLRVNKKAQEFS